jgi:hypothetical protein
VLTVAAVAGAQAPTPVTRIGDWVEIGNEAFMNIIASVDIRYRTTHNYDFENRVQDRAASRDNLSTTLHDQSFDGVREESRLGVDMRYQKNLTMRVLLEHQSVMDGNLIDNGRSTVGTGTTDDAGGGALGAETNYVSLERYWLEYAFPGTPVRLFVGAELFAGDIAGLIRDDDPRIAVYFDLGPKKELELGLSAVIKRESSRIGRVNDNDLVYYVFQATYKGIPKHQVGLSVVYFRDRYTGAAQIGQTAGGARQEDGELGQTHDSVLIMPGWAGTIGPLWGLLQFNVVAGTADTTNVISAACPVGTCANRQMDIFAWALIAYAEVKLGMVAPFVGIVYGSADDDPTDNKLHGFSQMPTENVTGLTGTHLPHLDPAIGFNDRDVESPARARATATTLGGVGGSQFAHSNDNQFNNRLGSGLTPGISTTYSNPGTVLPFVGLKVFPMKGHEVVGAYIYRAMADSALLEVPGAVTAAGGPISKSLYHNLFASWMWTLNRHFDIRLTGNVVVPAAGAKDVARVVTAGGCTAASPCQGDDPVLQAEARFRARF